MSDNTSISLLRIVSGGQTGADRGALDAAMECGIQHGGWCPKGRLAEDGIIDERYSLRESSSSDYSQRTELNVKDSDATLVFSIGRLTGGSAYTVDIAKQVGKEWQHVDLGETSIELAALMIRDWLKGLMNGFPDDQVFVLNVAGSRESQAPGIAAIVGRVMVMVFDLLRQ